jgi:DNA mismatch repair protein MutL
MERHRSCGMGRIPLASEEGTQPTKRLPESGATNVTTTPIRLLTPDLVARIAAGEVVERPASVVKELVENAIDAGATRIRVELAGGGLQLIRVSDNGHGIPVDQLPLAFARHATSKIQSLDDLERVRTLGFRGEALASIGAVAVVTLVSRLPEAEVAAQAMVEHGGPLRISPVGAPPGTIVTVRDLFARVPARRKFLKSQATEAGHCLHLLQQYALAYPEIQWTVLSDGRQLLATAGDGRLQSTLIAVYGIAVADQMIPIADQDDTETITRLGGSKHSADHLRISGYTSRPTCYKSTRQYLSFFVNRRWVQSRSLAYAVEEAYHSLLLTGRHPIAVISIAIDPTLVDVNVHPAKTEVRFLRERQVYAAVQRAVRTAVLAAAEPPALAARAFSVSVASADLSPSAYHEQEPVPPRSEETPGLWYNQSPTAKPELPRRGATAGFSLPRTAGEVGSARATFEQTGRLPILRVLGQISQSYLITEGPDGIYLIDQHAAHERILLERMLAEWRNRHVASQLLLAPVPVELSPDEMEAIEERRPRLEAIGFTLEPFGPTTILVRAVPAVLAREVQQYGLHELLLELVAHGDHDQLGHSETWQEHALANIACKAAIKAGQPLALEEQRELIRQLEQVDARYSCCHGRPTMVYLSLDALERQFARR